MNIANKLFEPISSLIKGAEEVGGGNLDYKIADNVLSKINISEIKRLAQAFNLMISDLKSNRVDLEHANDQLDKRRKFSESVLSGVYSGVIGLDKNLKINLPNVTATHLLKISIEKDPPNFRRVIVKDEKNQQAHSSCSLGHRVRISSSSKCLMGSTNQANPNRFYFRML